MKDFFRLKEVRLSTKEISTHRRQKLKLYGDIFILNTSPTSVTSVKKEVAHEDEATILSKTIDQLGSNGGIRSVISSLPVARSETEVHQV
jgi:hypothetical protein